MNFACVPPPGADSAVSPRRAGLLLAGYVAAVFGALIAAPPEGSAGSFTRVPAPGRGDIRLHWDVVARMRGGEGFYPAMHAELRRHDYPTGSVFNWRAPPSLWLAARLPDPSYAGWIIAAGAVGLIVLTFQALRTELGLGGAYAGCWLMLGAVLPCFAGDLSILPLQWGAVCVGLALCCHASGHIGWSVVLGTLAACFRDLTAGYLLVMFGLAIWRGRRREAALWCLGMSAFSAFFACHAAMVAETIGSEALAQADAWLSFGGLPFLVSTARMNCWLLPLPAWLSAVYLPTALLGLATWRSKLGQTCLLLTCLYGGLFLVVGQPFNQYWGLLLAPPLACGAARGPLALVELVCSVRGWGQVSRVFSFTRHQTAVPDVPVQAARTAQVARAE